MQMSWGQIILILFNLWCLTTSLSQAKLSLVKMIVPFDFFIDLHIEQEQLAAPTKQAA